MASAENVWFCVTPSCSYRHEGGGVKTCHVCPDKPMLHTRCQCGKWSGSYASWYTHRKQCAVASPESAKQVEHERESKTKRKHIELLDATKGTFLHNHLRVCCQGQNRRLIINHPDMLVCCTVPAIMQLWLENEHVLSFKTGLSSGELDFVWRIVSDTLVKHYEEHHTQRDPPLSPYASLLTTLYWLRQYPTVECMAAEMDAKSTAIFEHVEHTLVALFNTLVPACFAGLPLPHRGYEAGSLVGVRLVVDSTFLILPRHKDKAERKTYYHFKSPTRQALKWQLAVTTDGDPFHVSAVVPGSTADVTLLRDSGLLDRLAAHTRILGDKGYIGEEKVVTPKKKPAKKELNEEEKNDNKVVNGKRVVVENCFHEFKKWAVLGGEYRGEFRTAASRERVTHIIHVIAALVKRRLIEHPLRARPAATV